MFGDDHLTLRSVRLNGAEKWQPYGVGLCFIFVRGGAGNYAAEPVTQRLGKGDVLVLNSVAGGVVHAANTGELAFSCFSVSVEHMYPLFSAYEISHLQHVMESLRGIKVFPAAGPLAKACQGLVGSVPPQFNLDHRSHLLCVVAAVLGEEFKSQQLQRHRAGFVSMEEHLIQVFEKLSASDLLNLSASELAGKFGCSRRHLNRLFHQHFGCSVASLRMEMRMLKAISLLREPAVKVINVAEQCGFNHLGLFNTCFKKRFGTSPGQWRNSKTQEPAPVATKDEGRTACPFESNGLCPMLGGPGLSNGSGPKKTELKSVALSAALTKPGGKRESGRGPGKEQLRAYKPLESGRQPALQANA